MKELVQLCRWNRHFYLISPEQTVQDGDELPLYLPATHVEQEVEADALYVPASQLVQAEDSTPVAALTSRFPAAQSEQPVDEEPLYWPEAQLSQAEDSVSVAGSTRSFPAAQGKQLTEEEPLY